MPSNIFQSQIGDLFIESNKKVITTIRLANKNDFCQQEIDPFNQIVFGQIEEYLAGKRQTFDLPLKLNGTPFQLKIWHELRKIPYGETRSYLEVAQNAGCPKSFRAVGNANGKNNIIIVIPCHRVIKNDGSLGGYSGGGTKIKQNLLLLEKR